VKPIFNGPVPAMTTCYKLQLKSDRLLCRLGFHKMGQWIEMDMFGYKTRVCKRLGGCGHRETLRMSVVAPKIEPLIWTETKDKAD
jgi:hypothetical protein